MTVDDTFKAALQHHQAGQLPQAEAIYRQILQRQPDHAEALHYLGVIACQARRPDIAADLIRRAIVLRPDWAEAHNNLGVALKEAAQFDEAIAACRQAIALKPDWAEAHYNLGLTLQIQNQPTEAIAACRQALALKPNWPEAYNSLGNALKDAEQVDEAVAAYRQAIALKPDWPEAHYNLGVALQAQWRPDEASAAYRRAIALKPDFSQAHSNLVYGLLFHPAYDAHAIADEHRRWNAQHAEPLRAFIQPHRNDHHPQRRLRIGYISPYFRQHVVGRTVAPVLAAHDRAGFEVFCYSDVLRPDAITTRMRSAADHWRQIVGRDDQEVAQIIRADAIDVLVDLTLHMADNRLLVFARKPAPVQVTHVGYAATTGLTAMDYRITDAFLDPPGLSERFNSETLVRLPRCWYCYVPDADPLPPSVQALPALGCGRVTFGSLSNLAKITPAALELWCRVLAQVTASRLVMLSSGEPPTDRVLLDHFARHGVKPERIQLVGMMPLSEYLRCYDQIDIGLDPFPYNGGITTCDALWMGVPVVTLRGNTSVGRAGVSILSNLGLGELIADTPEQYVRIAVDLARDLPRLQELRSGMRRRMQASPLTDAVSYARDLEAAYRQMWRQWCATAP